MKTAAQAAQKWDASTGIGGTTWAANTQSTQKPIVASAVAARAKMQAGFQAATAPGGVWETNLTKVGDAGIKAAVQNSIPQYQAGVSKAQPKFLSAITKILAYEAAGLSTLTPKSQAGSGKTRMNEWFDYMSAGKGTLGAS